MSMNRISPQENLEFFPFHAHSLAFRTDENIANLLPGKDQYHLIQTCRHFGFNPVLVGMLYKDVSDLAVELEDRRFPSTDAMTKYGHHVESLFLNFRDAYFISKFTAYPFSICSEPFLDCYMRTFVGLLPNTGGVEISVLRRDADVELFLALQNVKTLFVDHDMLAPRWSEISAKWSEWKEVKAIKLNGYASLRHEAVEALGLFPSLECLEIWAGECCGLDRDYAKFPKSIKRLYVNLSDLEEELVSKVKRGDSNVG
ncbi:hypothetical protein HDU97_001882 [Phlyctochytrium planicorne]|nr:hypothetical protein HDU97_001882 [Phlyctochytrium planicorne]